MCIVCHLLRFTYRYFVSYYEEYFARFTEVCMIIYSPSYKLRPSIRSHTYPQPQIYIYTHSFTEFHSGQILSPSVGLTFLMRLHKTRGMRYRSIPRSFNDSRLNPRYHSQHFIQEYDFKLLLHAIEVYHAKPSGRPLATSGQEGHIPKPFNSPRIFRSVTSTTHSNQ